MVRFTKKIGGRRKHSRSKHSRRKHSRRKHTKRLIHYCIKCHKRVKGYKKYCAMCKRKKQCGGARSGAYVQKAAGYSVGSVKQLRGKSSALANPPPYKSY